MNRRDVIFEAVDHVNAMFISPPKPELERYVPILRVTVEGVTHLVFLFDQCIFDDDNEAMPDSEYNVESISRKLIQRIAEFRNAFNASSVNINPPLVNLYD